ncbi:hypothetical protein A4X13_0g9058, partial [Tilletia indica]
IHFPLYADTVTTTGPASHPEHHPPSSRLGLTPASTTRPDDPATLQSALELVKSFQLEESASERFQCAADTKRVQTSALHQELYGLSCRTPRLTADQAGENVRGPHWLRAALLTPGCAFRKFGSNGMIRKIRHHQSTRSSNPCRSSPSLHCASSTRIRRPGTRDWIAYTDWVTDGLWSQIRVIMKKSIQEKMLETKARNASSLYVLMLPTQAGLCMARWAH